MKILAIIGSKNNEGQTARAVNALLAGAKAKGADCEELYLTKVRLEHCNQGGKDGWGTCSSKGVCEIKDDFAKVVGKIRESDAVVFATPVYFSDLGESMKAFLDRLRRISVSKTGRESIAGKKAIGICVAGGGGGGAPRCSYLLQETLATCGFDVIDMVPARRQNLDMKVKALKIAGEWLAGA